MFKDKLLNQLTLKNILCIITYTILLIICVIELDLVFRLLRNLLSLMIPFILAFIFAFIFNLPMRFFLKLLPSKWQKGRKLMAASLSLLCIIFLLYFIVSTVTPQFINSAKTLINEFPQYVDSTQKVLINLLEEWNISASIIDQLGEYSEEIESMVIGLASTALPKIISFTSGMIATMTNVVLAIVIAGYFTISKETLIGQAKNVLYAFLPANRYHYFVKVTKLSNKIFSGFISGQLVEAIIIGVLCYIGASILRIPYAPILAVIIGCTNIIPIFGPIIGTGICGVLLVFVNPIQAIIFVIFGTILQQVESNLIYPRVVGTSVGLSGLWVLLAVSIGGGLFGIVGMIFGLPVFAILFNLFSEEVNKRLKNKKSIKEQE